MQTRVIKAPNEIIPFTDPRIRYPMLASTKYDGHRMLAITGTRFLTPSGKDHVNQHILEHFKEFWLFCRNRDLVIDAELWSPRMAFNELQSAIRTHYAKLPDHVGLYVFDMLTLDEWNDECQIRPYNFRYYAYTGIFSDHSFPHVFPVWQYVAGDSTSAEAMFNDALEEGHEGIMLRSPNATYKHGRCTHLESHMYKFKHFVRQDAVIVGFEQMQRLKHGVARTTNEAGLLEPTYRAEDYEPVESVGAFIVSQDGGATTFKLKPGKGWTQKDREAWWHSRFALLGMSVEFSYMPHGTLNAPRIGSLERFRPDACAGSSQPSHAPSPESTPPQPSPSSEDTACPPASPSAPTS